MTDDTVRLMVGDKTAEVGITVDTVMREKKEIIECLTRGSMEKKLLIKELMITAYITGFFAGTASAHRDYAKTESN